jgi:hypothetical protein
MPQTKRSHHKVGGSRRISRSPEVPRAGKSPAEFCAAYGISRSTFEDWRRRGLGPAELQPIPGGRIIITEEAETAWKAKATSLAAAVVPAQ